MSEQLNYGFLLIDKPTGISSFSVLHQLDKHFSLSRSKQKLGHGGTLDPAASGLLVAAVGKATRLLRFFLGSDKRYLAHVRLGARTTTDDAMGEVTETAPFEHLHRDHIEQALDAFRGPIKQVPPDFSALHVNGKRAYELARKGREIELPARDATIYENTLTACDLPNDPVIQLDIACSGGTYIRSIARDLGQNLGCYAHLCGLRRTQSCRFDLSQAHTLDHLLEQSSLAPFLLPCEQALSFMEAVKLSQREAEFLMAGRPVNFKHLKPGAYRLQCEDNPKLLAVLEKGDGINITRVDTPND